MMMMNNVAWYGDGNGLYWTKIKKKNSQINSHANKLTINISSIKKSPNNIIVLPQGSR